MAQTFDPEKSPDFIELSADEPRRGRLVFFAFLAILFLAYAGQVRDFYFVIDDVHHVSRGVRVHEFGLGALFDPDNAGRIHPGTWSIQAAMFAAFKIGARFVPIFCPSPPTWAYF